MSCLAPSLFLPVEVGNTEGCGRGRNHLCRYLVGLIGPCRTPKNADTPLHVAALEGHATVVEKLLAAGAVTDAKTQVRRVGDEECM